MGVLESEVKRKTRITKLQKAILMSIKAVGFLSIALLAPNALQVLKFFGGKDIERKMFKYSANRSLSKLVNAGMVEFQNDRNKKFLCLTEKGKKFIEFLEVGKVKRNYKKWDGKWRIVTFDIGERRKKFRDLLRGTLVRMGFVKMQNSVWIFPYDCEDLIILLKTHYRFGREVLYVIADKIENDKQLRKYFNLQ